MTKDTRIPRLVYEYSPEEEISLEYPTAGVTTTRLVQEACEISRKAQAVLADSEQCCYRTFDFMIKHMALT